MKRPVIQDLVQSAMQKSASAQKIANEAARQMNTQSSSDAPVMDSLSTDYATKLANALDFIRPELVEKSAAIQISAGRHNADPAVLPSGVSATTLENGNPVKPNNTGHGLSMHMPPLRPGVEKGPNGGAPNQLKTTDHEWPGGKNTVQHTSLQSAPKTASEALFERNMKVAASITQSTPSDSEGDRARQLLGHPIESKRVEKTAQEELLERNMKVAFALTGAGHRYDAADYGARRDMAETRNDARQAYAKESPGMRGLHTGAEALSAGGAAAVQGVPGIAQVASLLGSSPGALSGFMDAVHARHNNYAAKAHEEGRNAYNPLGGLLTPTDREHERRAAKEAGELPSHLRKDEDDDAKTRAEKDKERQTPPRVPRDNEKQAGAIGNAVGTLGQKTIGAAYKGVDAIGKHVTSEKGLNALGKVYKGVDKVAPHAGKVGAGVLGVGALGAGSALSGHGQRNKQASIEERADHLLSVIKEAEDAINPAHISAGKHVPLDTDYDGHNFAARPKGPFEKFRTTEGVVNATPRDTVLDKIQDMKPYFKEPMLSAKHDNTLQKAFKHTAAAGAKTASVHDVQQVSEARLLLSKLAQQVSQEGRK